MSSTEVKNEKLHPNQVLG